MAAVVTGPTVYLVNGRQFYRWTVVQTNAEATSEYELTGFPEAPMELLYTLAVLQSGAGATVQPAFARDSGVTDSNDIDFCAQVATAAITVRDQTPAVFPVVSGGSVYVRSNVNAGSNNTIRSEFIFGKGVA